MVSEEKALNPEQWQIGFAGKDAIKESLDQRLPDPEKVRDFVQRFAEMRTLKIPSANPILELLNMGGISNNRAAKDTLVAMREALKRRIASLRQEQLETLLDKCYTYLTVPQLAPIAIATLEKLTYVDQEIWSQIVENGLEESPYVDLPLSIKRRIWASEATAFDHEMDVILNRVPELPAPTGIEDFVSRAERRRARGDNQLLTELLRMVQGLGDEQVAQAIDKMVERAAAAGTPKREAIANLFHDFVSRLVTRNNSALGTLRRYAKFLDVEVADGNPDQQCLRDIKEALSLPSTCGPVALLVASTYSRDLIADQLVLCLLGRRGAVGTFEDAGLVSTASDHVKADEWIPNLTYLCMANMKASMLLDGAKVLGEVEVDQPFQLFYPMMINEMYADVTQSTDQYFSQNATLPSEGLMDLVLKGRLERRVLTTYCMHLFMQNILVGLSRFRLLLDASLRACDNVEESRESTLAYHLISKIVES